MQGSFEGQNARFHFSAQEGCRVVTLSQFRSLHTVALLGQDLSSRTRIAFAFSNLQNESASDEYFHCAPS